MHHRSVFLQSYIVKGENMADETLDDILEEERSTGTPSGLNGPRLEEDGDLPFENSEKLDDGDKPKD